MSFDPTAVSFSDPFSIAQFRRYQGSPCFGGIEADSLVLLGGSIARLPTGNAATAESSGDRAVPEARVVWGDGFSVPRWGGALTCERCMFDGIADRSCDRAFGQ
jgi:hypothetical protein